MINTCLCPAGLLPLTPVCFVLKIRLCTPPSSWTYKNSQKPELLDVFCIYRSAAHTEISRLIQTSRDRGRKQEAPFTPVGLFPGGRHVSLVCFCDWKRRKFGIKAAQPCSSFSYSTIPWVHLSLNISSKGCGHVQVLSTNSSVLLKQNKLIWYSTFLFKL